MFQPRVDATTFLSRRRFIKKNFAVAAAVAIALPGAGAFAQDYPNKPITFIVPMGPGGGVDTISRLVGQQLSSQIGQSVVVENKAGAGGAVAASFVARANPDGYTVFVADTGQLSINPSLYAKLPYDASKPFVTITEAVVTPLFLAVNADLPVKSVKDLVDYAKKNSVTYGTTGVGSVHHLSMERLASQSGVKLTHVPYKGAAQAVVALSAGEVNVAFSAMPSLKPHVEAGRVRIIGVSSSSRLPLLPDMPTVAEQGLPGFDAAPGIGFVLPPGTPDAIATRLHGEFVKALAAPKVKQTIEAMSMVPRNSTPQEYAKQVQTDADKYRQVIQKVGIKFE